MRRWFTGNSYFKSLAFIAAFLIYTLTACEKEVDINLGDSAPAQLVVEGYIETGTPPFVLLTKSVGYFDKLNLATLANSFVHGAVVTVSDGINTAILKEYSVDTSGAGSLISFYTVDTASGSWMKGEVDKTYKLTISYDGKVYEAYTKIPNPTTIDSVVTAAPPIIPDNNPTAKQIKVYFKDPDTLGNYMRYYTRRNSEPFYPGLNSAYSDELINGTPFNTVFPLGENRNRSELEFDSLGFAHPGDTVTLKWCAIDKASYDFWSTFEFALGTIGSPFATPIKVKGNVSNGALGIWGGYGTSFHTIIIKE
jgi:hypothetical protein